MRIRKGRLRSLYRNPVIAAESLESRELLAVDISFDYRFDTSGFFDDSQYRNALNLAAQSFERRLNDGLAAITPGGSSTWAAKLTHPATGRSVEVDNLRVREDQMIIFVGSRRLGGNVLAFGTTGGRSIPGTATDEDFRDAILTRGQSGVSNGTDYASWGGAIAFDPTRDWYTGTSETGIGSDQYDFFSTAVHELGHVLGIGIADSWERYVSGSVFRGPRARAVWGGNVPLNDPYHWKSGELFDGQQTAFDPLQERGMRIPLTELDWAGLQDVGWQVGGPIRLSTSISTSTISEGDGSNAAELTITRSGSTDFRMRVDITNGDTSEISLSSSVNIPAGQRSVTVPITARDDSEFDGDQRVTVDVSATLADSGASRTITVTDDEVVSLALSISPSTVNEWAGADAAVGTVTRDGPLDRALTVTLLSTDRSEVRVGSTVTIPANETSAEFFIDAVDDSVFDRQQSAIIRASASSVGADPAERNMNIRDDEVASPIDIDQDGVFEPLGDGVIGIRYMAGFTGRPLTDNAVNPEGDRTAASQIIVGLDAMRELLDIDQDGTVQPLTDGVLMTRYYAGFTGSALTRDAINPDGQRTSAAAIVDFLDELREMTDPANGASSGGGAAMAAASAISTEDEFAMLGERRVTAEFAEQADFESLRETQIETERRFQVLDRLFADRHAVSRWRSQVSSLAISETGDGAEDGITDFAWKPIPTSFWKSLRERLWNSRT